jgi:stress-induced morphogen
MCLRLEATTRQDAAIMHATWQSQLIRHICTFMSFSCSVEVISNVFEGKKRIDRHRLVHQILHEELNGGVHALALKLTAPSEQ